MAENFGTEQLATFFLALALLHTFSVSFIVKIADKIKKYSLMNKILHILSEVEVVFGFWAIIFLSVWSFREGAEKVITFGKNLSITEPIFIFCIVVIASTKPILYFAQSVIVSSSEKISKLLKANQVQTQFLVLLIVGPLLGSFITEPAAITIVGLVLMRMFNEKVIDSYFLYGLTALLFVNISVGGALTHFAAPPVLVVARIWEWNIKTVFMNLGIPATIAVVANTFLFRFKFKSEIGKFFKPLKFDLEFMPFWVISVHLFSLFILILSLHHPIVLILTLFLFVVFSKLTAKFQDNLRWKESFLVAFFLMGLLILGSFQYWWLQPIITQLSDKTVFLAAISLTAITDNAALTYLGAQVPNLKESAKWALVSGALAGGGLTILANAPNPVGFSLLISKFPNRVLMSGKLLVAALIPTLIAVASFFFFGNF